MGVRLHFSRQWGGRLHFSRIAFGYRCDSHREKWSLTPIAVTPITGDRIADPDCR